MTGETLSASALSRRKFLQNAATGLIAITVLPSGLVTGRAFAQMPQATEPATFASLVQMSRDCYPHDQLEDRFYATAVQIIDEAARAVPAERDLLESGMGSLNQAAAEAHGRPYAEIESEEDRVALLRAIEDTAFFQKVRGNLVVGLYNQKELWPIFGYEGSSFEKGGYLNHGFDDIDWLT